MPWRDHGVVLIGDSARDLARHFIQKWNQCKVNINILKHFSDSEKLKLECFLDREGAKERQVSLPAAQELFGAN